ncbi:MAG: hypothetical protein ACFB6R_11655 [Alphaproteobacteria bacterium]
MRRLTHADPRRPRAGFALVLVLWVMALLALIVSAVITATRTRHDLTRYTAAEAQAKAVAEGGLYVAIHALLSRDGAADPWRFDTERSVRVGRAWARVRVRHEGGKIDLVAASPDLMVALMRRCGLDRSAAEALTADIIGLRRMAEAGEGAGLTGLGDLTRFTDLTPADGLQLQALATVHSGNPEPVAPIRAPAQAAWADWLDLSASERRAIFRKSRDRSIGRSHDLLEIRSAAAMVNGTDYTIVAVVRLLPGTRTPFAILSWERHFGDPGPLAEGGRLACPR